MSNIVPFMFEQSEIRVIKDDSGSPWFVGMDVASALGYSDTDKAVRTHCKLSKLFKPADLAGLECGPRGMMLIPEPDVYRLIAKSTLPAAEQFEAWIFEEVLPAIRKHGMYGTPDFVEAALADPDTMIRTLQALKAEKALRIAAEETIENQRPKVLFADAVTASDTSILVGEMAKILRQNGIQTGQNRFFEWLRDNGYLIKRFGGDFNMPTQKSMELELFEIKERTVVDGNGCPRVTKTPKITGKGQQYFINKFLSEAA